MSHCTNTVRVGLKKKPVKFKQIVQKEKYFVHLNMSDFPSRFSARTFKQDLYVFFILEFVIHMADE